MEKQALLKEQEARLTGTKVQTCSKEELRRWILRKRGGLSETEKRKWDAALFERIRALGLHGAGTVYWWRGGFISRSRRRGASGQRIGPLRF